MYISVFHFWKKIFAMAFAMGVVSGLVLSYQFGTNWSGLLRYAGPVIGPLIGYEVLTAFFLEAGFLGIMLFGKDGSARPAFFRHVMVAFGTLSRPAGFSPPTAGCRRPPAR